VTSIEITPVEVLALKKLVLINAALADTLENESAKREQTALLAVLNNVVLRADMANRKAGRT
jgi:hypothetical protein